VEPSFNRWLSDMVWSRGMSNIEFARQLDVSHNSVSLWFNGKSVPKPAVCYRIATALGIEPEDVLRRAGHVITPPQGETGPESPENGSQAVSLDMETYRKLSAEQQEEVNTFIQWVRERDKRKPR
jgi:transcriptional regulator with XRE-family HTH domain